MEYHHFLKSKFVVSVKNSAFFQVNEILIGNSETTKNFIFMKICFMKSSPTKSTILGKFYKNSTQIFEKFKIFIRFGIFDKFQQTKQIPDFFFDNCNMIKTRKRPIFLNFLLISACFFKRKCFVPPICFRCRRTKSGLYVSS